MKQESEIKALEELLVGSAILSVDENESTDVGIVITLDSGIKIDICFDGPGWCKIII
jgi:hypothetical protein